MSREYWTERGIIPRWQLFVAYVLIALAFAFSSLSLHEQAEANTQAIIVQCQETNHRNEITKHTLIVKAAEDIRKAEANAKARKQNPELFKNEIEGRRDVTLALIDGLVPKRDCDHIVKK